MVEAQNLYKNLENASNIFRYNHFYEIPTRIDKYYRAPIAKNNLNLSNPLSLSEAGSNFYVAFGAYDKGMKHTLDELSWTYEFYKFTSPQIYINSPYEIYSRDVNLFYNTPKNKVVYIVEPKQTIIDDNLKDYGPEA